MTEKGKGGIDPGGPEGRKMESVGRDGPTRIGRTRLTAGSGDTGSTRATGRSTPPPGRRGARAPGPNAEPTPGRRPPVGDPDASQRPGRQDRRTAKEDALLSEAATRGPTAVAREEDRIVRRRHHKILVLGLLGTFALLLVSISTAVYLVRRPPAYLTPAHASGDPAGILAGGSGRVRVDLYVDYDCAACARLESSTFAALNRMVAATEITLVYHPVALLDRLSTTQYSTRAASSVACAADRNDLLTYASALFAALPRAGPAGLSDDQLIQVAGQAGIIDPAFAQCVRAQRYRSWVTIATARADLRGITAPTVMVGGAPIAVPGTAPTLDQLTTAVTHAVASAK
jgi:protein-disulfide isomerase